MRDRATLHLEQLEGKAGGPDAVQPRVDVNLVAMEKALADYLAGHTDKPFDIVSGPVECITCIPCMLVRASLCQRGLWTADARHA